MNKVYACIDLKSFYASVECVERKLDPLTTNLVVADSSRTEKTVCLAITPSLKQYGLGGRARLFEVIKKVKEVNIDRKKKNNYKNFRGKSYNDLELKKDSCLELDYIKATPRMGHYMEYSTNIYKIYLEYIAAEDIFAYSIDEVFCYLTPYLNYYKLTPRELITKIIHDVYNKTGITATAGIGSNMYLAKIAMDVEAKKMSPDKYGVRIAELDEYSYRKKLWDHKPLTSFWRIGKGYANKLEKIGLYTMGDIARCSLNNEDILYNMFGTNAELLIDHAWGYEPCTIKDIKNYKPTSNSITSGQVLHKPYNYIDAKLIVKEMADLLALDLVRKKLVTSKLTLTIHYDVDSKINEDEEVVIDSYGRTVPKPSHGTINIEYKTSSSEIIINKFILLYDRIIKKELLIRKVNICAIDVINETYIENETRYIQYNLFSNNRRLLNSKIKEKEENKLQHTILDIKEKYGKNSILKGMNLDEKATTRDRNKQIGGHRE